MHATEANELYAGADLHGNNVFLSICDHDGGNVFRRRVKTNLEAVSPALAGLALSLSMHPGCVTDSLNGDDLRPNQRRFGRRHPYMLI